MDIKEIQNLIKFVAKSGAHEVKLEMEDFKITIKTATDQIVPEQHTIVQHLPATAPAVAAPASAPASSTTEAKADAPADAATDHLITIKSPIIGTFYRKPSPDKPNFVEVGSAIAQGDVLCVIEAMKLFNEIESEHSGKIVKILVDDASPVEFDQPLFLIDPS